mmetsp:Transcript_21680/g.35750  ORF Transcript_21680/g.35750 Transcript_21680/m.35750 type:complete len:195 (+) Transcript_21680:105-689(+)|eukprot:CAMPEP_0119306220 /NCGR_PEP_ID=MMETSP1333-20130426/7020_1 /TAXON_ID=418940 /ORGANISM="Scyphosphaera apsteinii, Strain RCC1455" /LENGTH=194 /DNA_ID=CAMNT_0007309467 /DNA_START=99 /DNA_END=683 /DNA_ORIENTATION=+
MRASALHFLSVPVRLPRTLSTGVYSLGTTRPRVASTAWVAPNSVVVGNVVLKEFVSIWFGVTIRGDNELITVGDRTNIQDGTVLHSDWGAPLTIGDNVTVGHMAVLHGCTVGDESLIGIGATVLNKAVIGRNCLIGAHALVPEGKAIPDGSLAVGSPAKVIRRLTEEQIEALKLSAKQYVENAIRFKTEFEPFE